MPIYEYTCRKCETKFEKLVRSMEDGPAVQCPECGSKQTEKALSVFAVGAEAPRSSGRPPGCGNCAGGGPCPLQE